MSDSRTEALALHVVRNDEVCGAAHLPVPSILCNRPKGHDYMHSSLIDPNGGAVLWRDRVGALVYRRRFQWFVDCSQHGQNLYGVGVQESGVALECAKRHNKSAHYD
jgi:hypothetical protein